MEPDQWFWLSSWSGKICLEWYKKCVHALPSVCFPGPCINMICSQLIITENTITIIHLLSIFPWFVIIRARDVDIINSEQKYNQTAHSHNPTLYVNLLFADTKRVCHQRYTAPSHTEHQVWFKYPIPQDRHKPKLPKPEKTPLQNN